MEALDRLKHASLKQILSKAASKQGFSSTTSVYVIKNYPVEDDEEEDYTPINNKKLSCMNLNRISSTSVNHPSNYPINLSTEHQGIAVVIRKKDSISITN